MKIATFNVNNINKRLANLLAWLKAERPDVVCLQELKAADHEFPKAAIEKAGYRAAWRGQKSWNGVAILARGCETIVTRTDLPGDPGGASDAQARYIEAAVNGVLVTSLYAPNGNPQPGPKFEYKLAWTDRLIAHAADLFAAGVPVVLAGDYNVVPADRDIYPTKSYDKDALVQPQTRARFEKLLEQGWRDAIRSLHPDAAIYTYWSYLRNRWPRDAGLRIDHLLLSREAAKRLVAAGVDREVRGENNASDHAPAWVELRDTATAKAPAEPAKAQRTAPTQTPQQQRPRALRPAPSTAPAQRTKPAIKPSGRRPLLAIDGDSFAHRAYHALPKNIRRDGGRPAGAILGFANLLLRLYREEAPRAVLVGWDTYEAPTYRHEQFAAYQSGREFDDDLIEQLAIIPDFVAACGFANAKRAGFEADDFLAAAAAAEERRGGTVLVASGDRDTFQLASDKTTILYPIRGGGVERIGPAQVRARYGVDPVQVPDFIALRGDPSDKLPGAPGVGAGGAATLLRQYGSLTAILKVGRFAKQAEDLRMFRSIATMNRKAPLPRLPDQTPDWGRAAALAGKWQLKQLAGRLEEMAPRGRALSANEPQPTKPRGLTPV
jgi:exodeoxyribonuclease III